MKPVAGVGIPHFALSHLQIIVLACLWAAAVLPVAIVYLVLLVAPRRGYPVLVSLGGAAANAADGRHQAAYQGYLPLIIAGVGKV